MNHSHQRVLLLAVLRNAVGSQIELWDSIQTLEALVDVDFDPLLWVETVSSLVSGGADLSMAHVADYLNRDPASIDCDAKREPRLELLLTGLRKAVDLQIKSWTALEQLKNLLTVDFDPAVWVAVAQRQSTPVT